MDTSRSKVKEPICQICFKKLDFGRFCREHIQIGASPFGIKKKGRWD